MLRFAFNHERFSQALNYLLGKVGPKTHGEICKLMYLADRLHLLRHARPIAGGPYHALRNGPVPSFVLDTLEDLAWGVLDGASAVPQVPPAFVSSLERYVTVAPGTPYPVYAAKGSGSIGMLADSDREVLDQIAAEHGSKPFIDLVRLTHQHAAWRNTPQPAEIDYRLFFVDAPEGKDSLDYLSLMLDEGEPAPA